MSSESKKRVRLEDLNASPKDNVTRWAIHLVRILDKKDLDAIFELIKSIDKYQDSWYSN